ncbi:KilA-N domain-containing protein [Salmonella enterica subsp. enterica]|nr:KilA-N domain-containing protein [Salmonella enterica subsp. enterica]
MNSPSAGNRNHIFKGLSVDTGKNPVCKTSRARKDRGGGTWLHPKLAVRFARWLHDFEIRCDEQIDAMIRLRVSRFNDPPYDALFVVDRASTP